MDVIYPYIKSTQVFHCPDDSGINGSTGNYIPYQQIGTSADPQAPNPGNTDDKNYGSYAMNSAYWGGVPNDQQRGPGNTGPSGNGFPLSALNSPATTIWVTDGDGSYQSDWPDQPSVQNGTQGAYPAVGTFNSRQDGATVARHGGPDLSNVLYCDGHVKSQRISTLIQPNSIGEYAQFTLAGQ